MKTSIEMEKVLHQLSDGLRDTFYSSNKKNAFHVYLNSNGLLLHRDGGSSKDLFIHISDIIGGRCVRLQKKTRIFQCGVCTPKAENSHCRSEDAYLYVFAYVLKGKYFCRKRTMIALRFRSFDFHEDNMREAEKWYTALKKYRENFVFQCESPVGIHFKSLRTKRLLILLNPRSGSGKAKDIFYHQVVPVLNEAEIPYDLYITKNPNFAFDFVRKRNLSQWTGIVALGGDGLFHEILNAVLMRFDWKSVIETISLGIVPCGSGNGLARSIAHSYNEPYDTSPILGAALTLVSGHLAKMDVVEIKMDEKILYSFLSVGWGLISDIDIESERLRPLGYKRYTIWTLHRLLNLRTYHGRISYVPKIEVYHEAVALPSQVTISMMTLPHSPNCNVFANALITGNYKSTNFSDTDREDGSSLQTLANPSFPSRCGSWLSADSRKTSYYSIAESIYHSISDSLSSESSSTKVAEENINSQYISLMEKNSSSIKTNSNKWVEEDGDFIMIHAVYKTHLCNDCFIAPQSKPNDGTIYLVMIRGGISRSELLNFLINMKSGTHLPSEKTDYIEVQRVEEFRLEPQNNGILTVDGERVKCAPLQAKIIPRAVNIMIPQGETFNHHPA